MFTLIHIRCLLLGALLSLGSFSCVTNELATYPASSARSRADYVAYGKEAMIATAHPLASAAGLAMLEKGGNAVDAAVAASFAISVVRPQSTGIGGGGFMLYYDKKQDDTKVYDFRERAPLAAKRDMYLDERGEPADYIYHGVRIPQASLNGHLAVGVPGLVAGLIDSHARYGKLSLPDVVEPAIRLAEDGFIVYPDLAEAIQERMNIMNNFPATREIFLPHDKPLLAGDLLVQKDLAKTLKQIAAKGKAGFYEGEVGEKIVAEMAHGGILSQQDLKEYQVKERSPVSTNYHGHRVVSMPPPSSGGTHIVQILNMLSEDKIGEMGHNSAESVHLLAEAMRRAYADRAKYLGDPDFVNIPLAGLLSRDYALTLRQSIRPRVATPSSSLAAGNPGFSESPSTTHISVVDREGNAVSTTQTINYTFGSCVVAAGTGVVLNDEMDDFSIKPNVPNAYGLVGEEANAVAARKTMLSSMSPSLVFDSQGALELVVGSPGGSRIITATLQTIINVVDYKMPLPEAVHAYRIHHQWYPDEIRTEPQGLSTKSRTILSAWGHKVRAVADPLGDVQAIGRDPVRGWVGVSDTRSDGKPMGF